MNEPIDLNESQENEPIGLPESSEPGESTPMYPQVTLSNPSLASFPNHGKAVIEHEVVKRTHEKDSKGKHHHRITVKIKSIRPMGRKKTSGKTLASENAMRDLLEQ